MSNALLDTSAQDADDRRADRIKKLPAWAREELKNAERERSVAVRNLQEFLDHQTPSPFFMENYFTEPVTDKFAKVFVQGYAMVCEAHDIRLRVSMEHGSTNNDSIVLQWEDVSRRARDVAMIPLSYHQVRLVAKENMR